MGHTFLYFLWIDLFDYAVCCSDYFCVSDIIEGVGASRRAVGDVKNWFKINIYRILLFFVFLINPLDFSL